MGTNELAGGGAGGRENTMEPVTGHPAKSLGSSSTPEIKDHLAPPPGEETPHLAPPPHTTGSLGTEQSLTAHTVGGTAGQEAERRPCQCRGQMATGPRIGRRWPNSAPRLTADHAVGNGSICRGICEHLRSAVLTTKQS